MPTLLAKSEPVNSARDRTEKELLSDKPSQPQSSRADSASDVHPRSLWQLIRPFAFRYRGSLILALFLNALPGIAIAFQTLAPKYLVDDVLKPIGLPQQERIGRLAILLGIYLFAAFVLRMGAWYASYRILTRVRERVVLELRARFFRHINGLCMRFYGKHSSGELFSYVMGTPLTDIGMFYHNVVINVPNAITTFLISCGWVFFWDWSLTLVLVLLVVTSVLAVRGGSGKLRNLIEDYQQAESRIVGRVSDIFRGNRDVKTHAIEERMNVAFEKSADQLRSKAYSRDVETHKVNMRPEAIGYTCFALLCVVSAWRYLGGHITEGELVAFLAAFSALQVPLNLIFSVGTMQGQARASLNRLSRILDTASTTPDPVPGQSVKPPPHAEIVLQNVSFSYNQGIPILRNIDGRIPFGQRIAFVGPSGSGKSTLAKLLLRLYDPESGAIRLNEIDLRDCFGSELRRCFGVVPQDPYFFATTIRENLQMMKEDASEELLRRVCELANAWEFIEAMPQGFDTLIGEGGSRLSGGQRQRLAIARALLHDPEYLIFDEATSALDTVSEQLVKEALNRILTNRTAIFIAHRLSTIQNCDRILVINNGRIEQDGTFAELSATSGLFRRMVESDRFGDNNQ
jgi:subfamily B ATP-binding cassette protein MsbA